MAATLLLSPAVFSQLRSSTIIGMVTDSSGAAVGKAEITVRERRTNITYEFKTDAVGQYTAPYLPFGLYSVSVKKPAFKTTTRSDIALETASIVRVDFTLEVGQAETTVTVEASAATRSEPTTRLRDGLPSSLINSAERREIH